MAAAVHLTLIAPDNEKFTVVPMRKPNGEYRSREHLTEREVARLIDMGEGQPLGSPGRTH